MSEPIALEQGASFDSDHIAHEMRETDVYRHSGHTARTVVRESDLRIVLVVMRAGSVIKEHKIDETISIQALSGKMRLRLPDRIVALASGSLLVLEPRVPHNVEALEDGAFLLTIGGRCGAHAESDAQLRSHAPSAATL